MRIPSASLLLPCALVLAACSAERARPERRDLTLMDPADQSATPAVVSARELAATPAEPGAAHAPAVRLRRPAPAPIRTPARPAHEVAAPAAPASAAASASAPEEVAAPAQEAGAGRELAPGQTVSAIPATSAPAPAPVPVGDLTTERGITRPVIIIGDDRCIPGRGEVIGRGRPHGFRGRL